MITRIITDWYHRGRPQNNPFNRTANPLNLPARRINLVDNYMVTRYSSSLQTDDVPSKHGIMSSPICTMGWVTSFNKQVPSVNLSLYLSSTQCLLRHRMQLVQISGAISHQADHSNLVTWPCTVRKLSAATLVITNIYILLVVVCGSATIF